nr:hypothetical protein [Tanacetum cinerariifolium]
MSLSGFSSSDVQITYTYLGVTKKRERIPDISYFHVFGCHVFIHNHKDHLGKFDAKADDGYFLGYSFVSKAFRVYNTRRQQIDDTYHVTFDESMEAIRYANTLVDEIGIDDSSRYLPDEFLYEDDPSRQYQDDQMITQPTDVPSGNNTEVSRPITESLVPNDTQSHISNQASTSMLTLSMAAKLTAAKLTAASASECLFADFLSKIEPKKFEKLMTKKFEMSMMGKLTYFLGLQIKQDDKGISSYQEQYTRNLLKKYDISDSFLVKTPMVPPNNLGFDLKGYSDLDYAIWTEKALQVDPFKDVKRSNVAGVKLSSLSKSDDTFPSLQALSDLYYLFGGFMYYLWSRQLDISNFGLTDRKNLPVSRDDMSYSYLIEYPRHSALTARIWM